MGVRNRKKKTAASPPRRSDGQGVMVPFQVSIDRNSRSLSSQSSVLTPVSPSAEAGALSRLDRPLPPKMHPLISLSRPMSISGQAAKCQNSGVKLFPPTKSLPITHPMALPSLAPSLWNTASTQHSSAQSSKSITLQSETPMPFSLVTRQSATPVSHSMEPDAHKPDTTSLPRNPSSRPSVRQIVSWPSDSSFSSV